jgi:hypothetical protein
VGRDYILKLGVLKEVLAGIKHKIKNGGGVPGVKDGGCRCHHPL